MVRDYWLSRAAGRAKRVVAARAEAVAAGDLDVTWVET
jgi:hypothetical protein